LGLNERLKIHIKALVCIKKRRGILTTGESTLSVALLSKVILAKTAAKEDNLNGNLDKLGAREL